MIRIGRWMLFRSLKILLMSFSASLAGNPEPNVVETRHVVSLLDPHSKAVRMTNRISFFCIIFILLSSTFLFAADDVRVSATINPEEGAVNSQFTYTLTVEGAMNIPAPTLPSVDGLTIYEMGTSSSFSFVNGSMSSSLVFNYVVVPSREGKFTIPYLTIEYKGRKCMVNPVSFNVTKEDGGNQAVNNSPKAPASVVVRQVQSASGSTANNKDKNIFVVGSVDKKEVFVNEPMIFNFQVYTRVNFLNQPVYKPAEMNGFWKEELPDVGQYRTKVNGREYVVAGKRYVLYPTIKGEQTIGSAELDCAIEEPVNGSDFWSGSFFSRQKNLKLETKPVKIFVKSLPEEGKPSIFKGSVGEYSMTTKITPKTDFQAGEPVTIDITIQGRGNINSITEPVMNEAINFKKYDTIVKTDIQKEAEGLKGKKIFKITLVPIVHGDLKLPDVKFAYFDYKKVKYFELDKSLGIIKVAKGDTQTEGVNAGQDSMSRFKTPDSSVKIISNDIHFIKNTTRLIYGSSSILNNPMFWFLLIFFPSIFLVLVGLKYYNFYLGKNRRSILMKKAGEFALRDLNKVLKKLKKQDGDVVQNIFNIFMQFLKNRFRFSQKIISIIDLRAKFDVENIDPIVRADIEDFWNELEYMRFSSHKFSSVEQKTLVEKLKNKISDWSV